MFNKFLYYVKCETSLFYFLDLSVLGSLPYLLELDASHNDITDLLDFDPPHNLRVVDMSFNHITTMTDLSMHHCLHALILDSILWVDELIVIYCIYLVCIIHLAFECSYLYLQYFYRILFAHNYIMLFA